MGKINQQGFIPMLITIFIVIVSVIGFVLVRVMKANK
jgi:hypothetical protein